MVIAAIGTPLVLWNYLKTTKNQQEENRPPIVNRLEKNFAFANQDKKIVSISDLDGKVWCYTAFTITNFDAYANTFEEMRLLEEKFSGREDFQLVAITLDPEHDVPSKLNALMEEKGFDSDRWLFLTAGPEKLRKYMKKQLKVDMIYQKQVDGEKEWVFPSFVGLIDKNRHLRQRYDFDQAHEERAGRQADLEKVPALTGNEEFMKRLNAPQGLRKVMYANIEHLFQEDLTTR